MARDDDGRETDDNTEVFPGGQGWAPPPSPDQPPYPPPAGPADPAAQQAPQGDRDTPTEFITAPAAGSVEPIKPAKSARRSRLSRRSKATEPAPQPELTGPTAPTDPSEPSTPPRTFPDNGAPLVPPGPALVAEGLGLLTKDGWVFQDINLVLRQSAVAAIVGPAGTGRSCLLLALSGRMAANTGSLTVAGHAMRDKPSAVRALTAVARIGSVTGPEPGLTVAESVSQQCLLEDVKKQVGRARFAEACEALQLSLDPTLLVGRLAGEPATLFAVALACVRVSAVIMLDDLDRDVSAAAQQRIVDALLRLAATGPTIVVSTTDRIPVMEAEVVLDLTPKDGAAVWQLTEIGGQPGTILRQLDPGGLQRDPVPPEIGRAPFPPPPVDPTRHDPWAEESPDPYADDSPYRPPVESPQPDQDRDQGSDAADAPTEDPR